MKWQRFKREIAVDRVLPLVVFISLLALTHAGQSVLPKRLIGRPSEALFLDGRALALNTAQVADLARIERISRKVAEAIVKRREELGGFKSFNEVDEVVGVGDRTLARLKAHLTLEAK